MHFIYTFFFIIFFFIGCSQTPRPLSHKGTPKSVLAHYNDINYSKVFTVYKQNCQTKKGKKLYGELCNNLSQIEDKKAFFNTYFQLQPLYNSEHNVTGRLTGYYEPLIHASLKKTSRYKYPLYRVPDDLITIELSSIYPSLKHLRLRGKLQGNKVVPYPSRKEIDPAYMKQFVLCYCDSKVDSFFVEVQGSAKVKLEDNRTINIGYANQNGHRYRSIGRYLIQHKKIAPKDISLQSIKHYLSTHPDMVDEVLNYNPSMVFFQQKEQGATGAMGVGLTPYYSVAVDRKYIPLGTMLFFEALQQPNISLHNIVFAQDSGGAIKGKVRADLFLGATKDAEDLAGKLNAKLKLWVFVPKKRENE